MASITKAVRTPLYAAMDAFAGSAVRLIAAFVDNSITYEEGKPIVLQWAADKCGCTTYEKDGILRLSRESAGYEAAKKANQRLLTALGWGKPAAPKAATADKVEVGADFVTAIAALAAAHQDMSWSDFAKQVSAAIAAVKAA